MEHFENMEEGDTNYLRDQGRLQEEVLFELNFKDTTSDS